MINNNMLRSNENIHTFKTYITIASYFYDNREATDLLQDLNKNNETNNIITWDNIYRIGMTKLFVSNKQLLVRYLKRVVYEYNNKETKFNISTEDGKNVILYYIIFQIDHQ